MLFCFCYNESRNDGESIEVARYEYDGYGNVTVYSYDSNDSLVVNNNDSFIGNINPYRYKGYYYDVQTCLYYLQSRYYSSNIKRFISPDSYKYLDVVNINGLNLYCYCNNNPVMYSDGESYPLKRWQWIVSRLELIRGMALCLEYLDGRFEDYFLIDVLTMIVAEEPIVRGIIFGLPFMLIGGDQSE